LLGPGGRVTNGATLGTSWATDVTIGAGRRARIEMSDLELLKARERAVSLAKLPAAPNRRGNFHMFPSLMPVCT
jgi:hypothetical protein